MSVSLKYDYLKYPVIPKPSSAFPRRFSASRPVIPIQLINGKARIQHHALIDSGADFCVFPAAIGEYIGLTIDSGKIQELGGIANSKLVAYFHNIKIEVGGYEFDCYAGFSRDMEHSLLGQTGFFSLFNVFLDYNKGKIELKLKNIP